MMILNILMVRLLVAEQFHVTRMWKSDFEDRPPPSIQH